MYNLRTIKMLQVTKEFIILISRCNENFSDFVVLVLLFLIDKEMPVDL